MAGTSQQGTSDGGNSTPPATTTPTPPAATPSVDVTKLEGDDLNKVLENPNLWKNPRLASLLESDKKLKALEKQQEEAENKSLAEQKKWEELAAKREAENQTLKEKIQNGQIDTQLSTKLYGQNVVDLDGALKLIDRSKISIDDSGAVSGIDEAIEALKTEKAYLFTTNGAPRVGNPSNPQAPATPGTGRYKFKESQITPEFYKANEKEILEAYRAGLIEPDGPPQQ